MASKTILFIEAFYGGSHKQLIDLLFHEFSEFSEIYTLPAKKWHWRSLASSMYFAEIIPKSHKYKVLFTSSVLPLANLVAIRPDLANLYKIVYFHENQMIYPVREMKDRYFQHGYNEVLTCLTADKVIFNSIFNQTSFLSSLQTYFNVMPDHRPKNLQNKIEPKVSVLYFPVKIPIKLESQTTPCELLPKPLHIVWPHRWEHDKNPEAFFSVLFQLKDENFLFQVSVIGENFTDKPKIFDQACVKLKDNIVHWGYQESKEDYFRILHSADVVISTSDHEFFGVSMIEAVMCNCYPLVPNKLVYPEIYPADHLYNTPNQLYKKLRYFCTKPYVARNLKVQVSTSKFTWEVLRNNYRELFEKKERQELATVK